MKYRWPYLYCSDEYRTHIVKYRWPYLYCSDEYRTKSNTGGGAGYMHGNMCKHVSTRDVHAGRLAPFPSVKKKTGGVGIMVEITVWELKCETTVR